MKFIIFVAVLCGLTALVTVAAERTLSAPKADNGGTPAIVTPQGGISFGEGATPSPAQQHRSRLRWPEMTQQEIDGLTVLLKNIKNPVPVLIGCRDSMCEELALNLDNAFESARWKTNLVAGSPFGVPDGITGSSPWIVDVFNSATGGRYAAKVATEKNADGEYLLIGPKPR